MSALSDPAAVGRADVLLHVQHLLGVGHLRRAALIARALDRAGLRVVVASGGMPEPGLDVGGARLVQLPPARAADASFSGLVGADGSPVDAAWKAKRAHDLCALFDATAPRVLLIELFPFGRRQMRFELLPLLERAAARTPRPKILSSVRDVLSAPSTAEKAEWALATFARYFDLALVHGDPAFLPLEQSFPRAAEIPGDRVRYTGYVVEPAPAPVAGDGGGEVLVSTGGGAVAAPLVEAALAARALSPLAHARWRILIGAALPAAEFERLRRSAGAGVTVERARPDFRALLSQARLSISQAGYNTVLEVLAAGVPAVVVPFAGAAETEQTLRAQALAARGLLTVVPEAGLTPRALADGIAAALANPPASLGALDVGGAAKTARIVRELLL